MMGALKEYTNYLNSLGLASVTNYDYKNKQLNIELEVERCLNRTCMMFQWHNLPDSIPQEQIEKVLQTQGYAIIGKADNDRLYAFYGALGGELDEYYRPTKAIVNNPYLHFNKTFTINFDCIVIKNDLMYQGLLPMLAKYVSQLIECDISLVMALINTRVQAYLSASDNKSIESAKQYLKDIENGKLGVIADSTLLESVKVNAVKDNYNLANIRETIQYIKGQLYNEIGLATNYNLKKERITQAEIELNTDYLYPLIDNMYQNRKEGIDRIKEMYGIELEVEYNSSWDYRAYNGEPIVTKGVDNDISSSDGIDGIVGSTDSGINELDDKDDKGIDISVVYENGKEDTDNRDNLSDISDNDNSAVADDNIADNPIEIIADKLDDLQDKVDDMASDIEQMVEDIDND